MKKQNKNMVELFMKKANNNAEECVKLLKKEAPKFVTELLRWEFCASAFPFIIGVVLIAASALNFNKALGFWMFLPIFLGLFGLLMCINYLTWAKILIAPRIFMIDWVRSKVPAKAPN